MRFLFVLLALAIGCAAEGSQPAATQPQGWLGELDVYAKVLGGVLSALGAVFGLPITVLHFRKTRAEIRKLELEAQALANSSPASEFAAGTYDIRIDGNRNSVQVLADPRFLGPLLLLLDFIVAWIVLTLAGYALGLFVLGPVRAVILLTLAAFLLVPIYREARRVKSVLSPQTEDGSNDAT